MRNFTLISLLIFFCIGGNAQVFTASDLNSIATLSTKKLDNFISRKGFISGGRDVIENTPVQQYSFVRHSKKETTDSSERYLTRYLLKDEFKISYKTTSPDEALMIKTSLLNDGDFVTNKNSKVDDTCLFFQRNDMTIRINTCKEAGVDNFVFTVAKKSLPAARDIIYAEDLLQFDSHEFLAYTFGRENVSKDIYFFSEKQVNKCSVLYPNTDRQVIFLWGDEANNCKLSSILIGGTLRARSAYNFNDPFGNNVWQLRNGIHSGMSLQELQMLNGGSLRFYGFGSSYSGIVVPEKKGNIDFKKNGIMLTCLNCNDPSFMRREIVDGSEAIDDNRKLYVFTIILMPDKNDSL